MLYDRALECEITPEAFWNYSPLEICDLVESYKKRQRQQVKQKVMRGFILAEVLTRNLTREKGEEIPHPWEYYPELFEEERKNYETEKEKQEIENYKEARRAYVQEFNRRRQPGK